MKHYRLFLSLFLCVLFMDATAWGQKEFMGNGTQSDVEMLLSEINFPAKRLINSNKPFLFYNHNGKNWCIVTENNEGYKVFSGKIGSNTIDSLLINSPILGWGINEFGLVPQHVSQNSKSARELIINNSRLNNSPLRISGINAEEYEPSVRDSLNNLYYTLYWLSNPDLRRHIEHPKELGVLDVPSMFKLNEKGFYGAIEFSGGISVDHGYSLDSRNHNIGFFELGVIGGWKFSHAFAVGLGVSGKYYTNTNKMMTHKWALPLYLDMRGSFIRFKPKSFTPFWDFNIGASFPDGFMVRPLIGLKYGIPHAIGSISIGYQGQTMKIIDYYPGSYYVLGEKRQFFSSITVKLGFEF